MMRHRISAIFIMICVVITLSSAMVSAQAEIQNNVVTLTETFGAEAANETFTLTVYRSEMDFEGPVAAADVRYIAEMPADEEGNVVFTFPFAQTSGAYPYHVRGESGAFEKSDILYYVNQQAYEDAMSELEKALGTPRENRAEALKMVLTKNVDALRLTQDFPIYQMVKNQDNSSAFERLADSLKLEMPADAMRREFQSAILLCTIETAENAVVQQIIEDYRPVLEISDNMVLNYYSDLSSATRQNVVAAVGKKVYQTARQMTETLYSQIALETFNEAISWQKLGEALKELHAVCNIDVEPLYKLREVQQNSVLQSLIKKKKYSSCSDFAAKLIAAMQYTTLSGSSGNAGGSLGGGNSKGFSAIMTPDVLDEIYENDKIERFNDLESVVWAREAILSLAAQSVISGYGNGTFAPNASVKREEFVKMLILALGFEVTDANADFVDISPESWYAPYVATAQKKGITTGNGDGTFGSGMPISRQDAAVMLARAIEIRQISIENVAESINFTDENQISEYAKEAVYRLTSFGIINGVGDGSFAPALNVTRAETAKMLYEVKGEK